MANSVFVLTVDRKTVAKLPNKLALIHGTINISSYGVTHGAPMTGITSLFKLIYEVILGGASTGGYSCRWDVATSDVFAYGSNGAAPAALAEAAAAANVGTIPFIAIGVAL